MRGPAAGGSEGAGHLPEQRRLMKMIEKAVAHDQIHRTRQNSARQITEITALKGNVELLLRSPLARDRQHRLRAIDADQIGLRQLSGEQKSDVARAATEIENPWLGGHHRPSSDQLINQLSGVLITVAEVGSGISPHLMEIIHQLRLRATLHQIWTITPPI